MILLYHNIVPDQASPGYAYTRLALRQSDFERHVHWLADHFQMLSLQAYLERRDASTPPGGRTLALTFDDGLASTFECAIPVLIRRGVPATFFVTSAHLDGGEPLWGSYLNALCYEETYAAVHTDEQTYPLITPEQRRQARSALSALARASGNPGDFCQKIAREYPLPESLKACYAGMSAGQLRAAGEHDLFEVGSHSLTHPYLSQLSRTRQAREIIESQRLLAQLSGKPVRYFAYPSGDYNRDSLDLLKEAGYQAAFATLPRHLGDEPRFEIERVGVYSPSLLKLHAKALGAARLARRFGLRVG